jgi:hypothetical protein
VEQQEVEGVDAAAHEAALGRHAQVGAVLVGRAETGIGETRVSLGALALPFVEVVADRPGQGVVGSRHSLQGAADERVGLPGAVGVGGDDRTDSVPRTKQCLEALLGDRLAEVHEAPPAPAPKGDMSEHARTLRSTA